MAISSFPPSSGAAPRCIVSLTYDDALPGHYLEVGPLLAAHQIHATFYPHLSGRFFENVDGWRQLAAQGHELGNHTCFHPCYDEKWNDRPYHLRHYTPQRWKDEVALANEVLRVVDGQTERSFGNTCHNNMLGPLSQPVLIETLARDHFIGARGEHTGKPVDLGNINWFNLGTRGIDGLSFEELRKDLEKLKTTGGWWIYTLHGVGPRDLDLHMVETEHRQLITWLAAQSDIWTAPVRDVARRLRTPETTNHSRHDA